MSRFLAPHLNISSLFSIYSTNHSPSLRMLLGEVNDALVRNSVVNQSSHGKRIGIVLPLAESEAHVDRL